MSKERLEKELLFTQESLYRVHQENERYRKAIDRFFYDYTNENIEDVQAVIEMVETFRKALDGGVDE